MGLLVLKTYLLRYAPIYHDDVKVQTICPLPLPPSIALPAARLWKFFRADREKRRTIQNEFNAVRKI